MKIIKRKILTFLTEKDPHLNFQLLDISGSFSPSWDKLPQTRKITPSLSTRSCVVACVFYTHEVSESSEASVDLFFNEDTTVLTNQQEYRRQVLKFISALWSELKPLMEWFFKLIWLSGGMRLACESPIFQKRPATDWKEATSALSGHVFMQPVFP